MPAHFYVPRRQSLARSLVALVALVLGGCAGPPTEAVVRVETDMAQGPGQTLTGLRIDLLSGTETEPQSDHTFRVDLGVAASNGLLLPSDLLDLQPRGGDDVSRPVTVRVTALHDGDTLFATEAQFSFVAHHSLSLDVFLAGRCLQRVCPAGMTCGAAGCGPSARAAPLPAYAPLAPPDAIPAPRAVAPLSTSVVASHRPTLRWATSSLVDGAQIELCRDRACSASVGTFDATGSVAQPPMDLAPGVVFWRLRGRRGGRTGTDASPWWQFVVAAGAGAHDAQWGSAFDANGDGLADALIATRDTTSAGAAHAWLYYGRATAPGGARGGLFAGPRFDGAAGVQYARSVGRGGDLDGDGYGDFAIAAPGTGDGGNGSVYVYLGGPDMPRLAATIRGPDVPIYSDATTGAFGLSVSLAEDINLDGYGDLVIGAQFNARAYVYLGGPGGISADAPSQIIDAPGVTYPPPACTPLPSCQPLASFGGTVADVGDLNGDGYHDVLIGVPFAGTDLPSGSFGFSTAFVYLGGPAGLVDHGLQLENPGAAQNLREFSRSAMGAGDVNGDGLADVIVGAGQKDDPLAAAFVFYGSASPTALLSAPVRLQAGQAGCFGRTVSAAGDINGDGFADVMATEGQPNPGTSPPCASRVHFFLGGASGVTPTPAVSLDQDSAGASQGALGAALGRVGDADGDGVDDALVTAPGAPWLELDGAAYLYYGGAGPTGVSRDAVQSVGRADAAPGAAFGSACSR